MSSSYVNKALGVGFVFFYRWSGLLPVSAAPDAQGLPRFCYFQLIPNLIYSICVLGLMSFAVTLEGKAVVKAHRIGTYLTLVLACVINLFANFIQVKRGLFKNIFRTFRKFDDMSGFKSGQKCWPMRLVKMILIAFLFKIAFIRWSYFDFSIDLYVVIVSDYALYVSVINKGLICQLVVEIQRRLAHMNVCLAEVVSTEDEDENYELTTIHRVRVRTFYQPEEAATLVNRACRLQVLMGDAVHLLNSCFGLQMLALIAAIVFSSVYDNIILILAKPRDLPSASERFWWLVSDLLELVYLAGACSYTTYEASKTYTILSSVSLSKTPSIVRKQIKTLKILVELEPISFSAAGLFPISLSQMLKIITVSCSYFFVTLKN